LFEAPALSDFLLFALRCCL